MSLPSVCVRRLFSSTRHPVFFVFFVFLISTAFLALDIFFSLVIWRTRDKNFHLAAIFCFFSLLLSTSTNRKRRLKDASWVSCQVNLNVTVRKYSRQKLLSVFGRLWIPWHGGEPSVAQMRWTIAPRGRHTPPRGGPSPRGSPHSPPSPASAPGTAASPSARGSLSPAWASELHPTCWWWVWCRRNSEWWGVF